MEQNSNTYVLSAEMEVATGALFYGIVEDTTYGEGPDTRVARDDLGNVMFCDEGLPLTVGDLTGIYELVLEGTPFDVAEPFTQTLYHSAECVMNEMIRDLAGSVGDRFINVQTINYWKGVILEQGFWELFGKYNAAMMDSRAPDFMNLFTNREFDSLRPHLRVIEDVDVPGKTVEDLLQTTDIYGSFREITQHKIELFTYANSDLDTTRREYSKITPLGKSTICRMCCASYFVSERTEPDGIFGFCEACSSPTKK